MKRISSTVTFSFSITAFDTWNSMSVWLVSADFFKVQFTKTALKFLKMFFDIVFILKNFILTFHWCKILLTVLL
jgi:hypothetical protein